MAFHLLLLHSIHWLGQGRVCPGWHLTELRDNRERGYPEAGHGAGQEQELGQQTRFHCAVPGPLARPSIAPLCSAAAPAAFPAGTASREHRGRQSEVVVVLGGQGERRRVREEGQPAGTPPPLPGWVLLGAVECCAPWCQPQTVSRLRGGRWTLSSLPHPHHPTRRCLCPRWPWLYCFAPAQGRASGQRGADISPGCGCSQASRRR